MKNLILIIALFIGNHALQAQQKSIPNPEQTREYALNQFSKNLNALVSENTSHESKKLNIIKLIGHQLMHWHDNPHDIDQTKTIMANEVSSRTAKAVAKNDPKAQREFKKLANDVSNIVTGNASVTYKEMRVMQIIGYFVSQTQIDPQPVDWDKFMKNITDNPKIDQAKVSAYVQQIMAKNSDANVVPNRLRNALGSVDRDPNLKAAIEIYETFGAHRLGKEAMCEGNACDKNNTRNVKSRGAATIWQYTGEKRFFTSQDNFGWRYRCVLVNPNSDRERKSKTLNAMDDSKMEEDDIENSLEFSWKREQNVDRW